VKLHSDEPLPIQTLQQHLGGRIHGPYCYRGKDQTLHRFLQWYLTSSALRSQIPFFYKHLPPSKKREQFEIWMDTFGLYAYVIMVILKQR